MFLRFDNVAHTYADSGTVLDIPELTIEEGSFVALIGSSGCGKSTFLRLLSSLERPSTGTVHIAGAPADGTPDSLAMVFQEPALLPWLTVENNIALPFRLTGKKRSERRKAAERGARRVGLADALSLYPNQLSGGMKMRVSLARALATEPRLVLLDEPFAALDEITRNSLNEDLSLLHHRNRWTTVLVTHSVHEAAFLADRILVLSPRPGRIAADLSNPAPQPRPAAYREDSSCLKTVTALHRKLREHAFA